MLEFNFIGGAYEARSTNLNAQRCQNLYPVVDGEGGKNVIALMSSPGLKLFADASDNREVRQVYATDNFIYAVVGDSVYKVNAGGAVTQMTGSLNKASGYVAMAENLNDEICITDNPNGYILDVAAETVTQITSAGFPLAIDLTHQDGYFIAVAMDSAYFNYSNLNDGLTWDALSYYSEDSQPDYLVACRSTGRDIWAIGSRSTGIWYNDASPFSRYQNVFFEVGCSAVGSICVTNEGIIWLDDQFRVVIVPHGAYQIVPKSTYQIEYQIKQASIKDDARAYWYRGEGYTFYVITFPSLNKTFELNLTTGLWNTRASGYSDARHRGNCSTCFRGKWIIGDYNNGKLYELDYNSFTEDGETMRAVRRAQVVHKNRNRLFHHELEVEFEAGVGIAVGQGSNPMVMLRYSDDGGHTWSNERTASLGLIGEYDNSVKWNRLGSSKERIYEVVVSDPVKRNIINAYLNVEEGY